MLNRKSILLMSAIVTVGAYLALPAVISADPVVSSALPASVAPGPVKTYEGWTGTQGDMTCTDSECTNANGCAWFLHNQYDWYYPQLRCEHTGASGSGDCTQTTKLCRETKGYSDFNCTGNVTWWTQNYYGACTP